MRVLFCVVSFLAGSALFGAVGQPLQFPTANQALLEPGGEERFFVGTAGRSWPSGMFGCVRTEGRQMHEGLDIRCIERDSRGEPRDPVLAVAGGAVAYVNPKAGLSNYGKYIVLRHQIDGLEIYSLYGHLSEIAPAITSGRRVEAGQRIGTMGRTANTRSPITKDRAHVHFELNLFINERFTSWYKKTYPGQRNDHGRWNGQNLLGLDPRLIFLAQASEGDAFNLLRFVRNQTALCRVLVRDVSFPWLRRYTPLIQRNPVAETEGVVAYELALDYNGVPFQLIPRAAREVAGTERFQLLSVNSDEAERKGCRRLVIKKGDQWQLGPAGIRLLELLTY